MDSQVAAKAVIVHPDGDKVLIMREAAKGGNKWQAPGGRLEHGETLRDGLLREVFEETGMLQGGVKVGDVIYVNERFARPEGELKHIVAIFYEVIAGNAKIRMSDEHDDFAWVDAKEIDSYDIFPEIVTAAKKVLNKKVC